MQLPKFPTIDKSFSLLQTQWAQSLNPIISLPMLQQNTLTRVKLVTGPNKINHLLQRTLQGWFLIRKRSAADVFDEQDANSSPDLTLILNASADVTVDLVVF